MTKKTMGSTLLNLCGTVNEVSAILKLPVTTVRHWMIGERKPAKKMALKIQSTFGINADSWERAPNRRLVNQASVNARARMSKAVAAAGHQHKHRGPRTKTRKVLTAVYVDCHQKDALKQIQLRTGKLQSALIREGIEVALKKYAKHTKNAPCLMANLGPCT